jgi:hypothetical protein
MALTTRSGFSASKASASHVAVALSPAHSPVVSLHLPSPTE